MSLVPGPYVMSNGEARQRASNIYKKAHNDKLAQGFREVGTMPYRNSKRVNERKSKTQGKVMYEPELSLRFETPVEKTQREELAKSAYHNAQMSFNHHSKKWKLQDARSTAIEIVRREAIAEASKVAFFKDVIRTWLNKKGGCDRIFPARSVVPSMPSELKEGVELLKESYPHANVEMVWKEKAKVAKSQVSGYVYPETSNYDWCMTLLQTEKELVQGEKDAFIQDYISTKADRIQKIVNEIEGDKNMIGLRKLVGNNSNNNLLKFNREEELKGLFNAPSNTTRSRKRKNRKTLRKRR